MNFKGPDLDLGCSHELESEGHDYDHEQRAVGGRRDRFQLGGLGRADAMARRADQALTPFEVGALDAAAGLKALLYLLEHGQRPALVPSSLELHFREVERAIAVSEPARAEQSQSSGGLAAALAVWRPIVELYPDQAGRARIHAALDAWQSTDGEHRLRARASAALLGGGPPQPQAAD